MFICCNQDVLQFSLVLSRTDTCLWASCLLHFLGTDSCSCRLETVNTVLLKTKNDVIGFDEYTTDIFIYVMKMKDDINMALIKM